jgi:hypothetical protein
MANVSQAEFGRAARGAPVTPGLPPGIEPFILGMGHSARAAIRDVHRKSPAIARADFVGKVSGFLLRGDPAADVARDYIRCIDRYIAWDGEAAPAAALPTKPTPITFAPGDIVRAKPDVVLEGGAGKYEAQVLLWDDLALGDDAAEMIALPTVEYVETEFGAATAGSVSVWQLETSERKSVAPSFSQARRADVQALLAAL